MKVTRRKRRILKMSYNPKKQKQKYSRKTLRKDQRDFLMKVYSDTLFFDTLNRVYRNTLRNALDTGTYSSAPIVRGNLTRICEEYVEHKKSLNAFYKT